MTSATPPAITAAVTTPATAFAPIALPTNLKHNLPGQYLFVVERWANGVPVEVLARRIVLVDRS